MRLAIVERVCAAGCGPSARGRPAALLNGLAGGAGSRRRGRPQRRRRRQPVQSWCCAAPAAAADSDQQRYIMTTTRPNIDSVGRRQFLWTVTGVLTHGKNQRQVLKHWLPRKLFMLAADRCLQEGRSSTKMNVAKDSFLSTLVAC